MTETLRIGIDLGGTKIAAIALAADDEILTSHRIPAPRDDYDATLGAIEQLVARIENELASSGTVGVGTPGAVSPHSGVMQNANSVWLNGRALHNDLEQHLERPVRLANDANCFALSEAADGAARDARCVFGVILGTGCGGGIVIDGACVVGPRAIGGEWGHNPLPWCSPSEYPGPACWCGRQGCIETWLSGPALARDHLRQSGQQLNPEEIVTNASRGDKAAAATLDQYEDRLARSLAMVINILDPDIIVLGGGLSNLEQIYAHVPGRIGPYVFADYCDVKIVPPAHGDASGVRGAARLWDLPGSTDSDHRGVSSAQDTP